MTDLDLLNKSYRGTKVIGPLLDPLGGSKVAPGPIRAGSSMMPICFKRKTSTHLSLLNKRSQGEHMIQTPETPYGVPEVRPDCRGPKMMLVDFGHPVGGFLGSGSCAPLETFYS